MINIWLTAQNHFDTETWKQQRTRRNVASHNDSRLSFNINLQDILMLQISRELYVTPECLHKHLLGAPQGHVYSAPDAMEAHRWKNASADRPSDLASSSSRGDTTSGWQRRLGSSPAQRQGQPRQAKPSSTPKPQQADLPNKLRVQTCLLGHTGACAFSGKLLRAWLVAHHTFLGRFPPNDIHQYGQQDP